MLDGKLISCIKLLSAEERQEFYNRIRKHKRKTLGYLYAFVYKHLETPTESKITKERVFQKTFSEEFTPQKDYLLRNEFRLLVQELEDFLKEVTYDEQAEKHFLRNYLMRIIQSKNWHFFEKEWNQILLKYPRDPHFNYEMQRIYQRYMMAYFTPTEANYKELHKKSLENIRQAKANYWSELSLLMSDHAYTERVLNIYSNWSYPYEVKMWMENQELEANRRALFYRDKALSYYQRGDDKIRFMEVMLETMQPEFFLHDDEFLNEKLWVISTIGLEYSITDRYEQAREYYKLGFQVPGFNRFHKIQELLFNYIGILNKLERFDDVIEVLEEQHDLLRANPKISYKLECARIIAFIFTGRFREASIAILRMGQTPDKFDYLYMRLTQVLVALAKKDADLAEREISNFLQIKTLRDENFQYYKGFVKFMSEYNTTVVIPQHPDKESVRDLHARISNTLNSGKQELHLMQLVWLKRDLSNLIESWQTTH